MNRVSVLAYRQNGPYEPRLNVVGQGAGSQPLDNGSSNFHVVNSSEGTTSIGEPVIVSRTLLNADLRPWSMTVDLPGAASGMSSGIGGMGLSSAGTVTHPAKCVTTNDISIERFIRPPQWTA